MEIRLDVKDNPKTTASFAHLVRRKFYDGDDFHRIIAGFVIQGGDPLNNGLGEPGYRVVEDPGANTRYPIGTVAMAKSQADPPGASGSQFFVVTGDDTPLDPVYAVVGRVTKGKDVADRISQVETDPATDMPVDPVVIEKATVKNG
jgi:peptidyl-prolyl cis-trans isomerase B (cyclophilin B)